MDHTKIWKVVLAELEIDTDSSHHKTIFKHSESLSFKDGVFEFSVPTDYTKGIVETKYFTKIQEIISRVASEQVALKTHIKAPIDKRVNNMNDFSDTPMFKNVNTPIVAKSEGLYPQFTFDKYIVGSHNRLAHAVAMAITENPGKAYNPFFLYSQVGLGKTHLVQAIGNQIKFKFPELRVVYTSGEQFVNELLEAIRGATNRGKVFRDKYRSADVLIIDDVQFLAGKEATQEEFFNTFNTLHMAKKQIILTSDRPPREIKKLEDRLTSRFAAGMMADIGETDIETRIAILQSKNEQMAVDADPDVIERISEYIDTNIRELEGSFLQVITAARASGKGISKELVDEVLKGIKQERTSTTSVNDIVRAVSTYYDIKISEIKGKKRQKHIARARQVCMYMLRDITKTPYETIGDILGGRDHSTVIHGVNKIETETVNNDMLKTEIKSIEKNLSFVD